MGITSTLYDEYYNKEIVSNKLETPFGEVTMIKSGQKIPFEYTTKKYCFRNGISADIFRLKIDTRNHKMNDDFEIRIGNINEFEYYDSDENTVMQKFQNNKFCIAVIGFDSYYDFIADKFYGGYDFSFGVKEASYGIKYKIVREPSTFKNSFEYIIYTWIVFLPLSDEYDVVNMIDIELV